MMVLRSNAALNCANFSLLKRNLSKSTKWWKRRPKLHPSIQYGGMAYARRAAEALLRAGGVVDIIVSSESSSMAASSSACLIDALLGLAFFFLSLSSASTLLSAIFGGWMGFKWSLDRCEGGFLLKSSSSWIIEIWDFLNRSIKSVNITWHCCCLATNLRLVFSRLKCLSWHKAGPKLVRLTYKKEQKKTVCKEDKSQHLFFADQT